MIVYIYKVFVNFVCFMCVVFLCVFRGMLICFRWLFCRCICLFWLFYRFFGWRVGCWSWSCIESE